MSRGSEPAVLEPQESDLATDVIRLDGQIVKTRHSAFDMGKISSLFDGDWENIARTAPTRTAVIEPQFPTPHER